MTIYEHWRRNKNWITGPGVSWAVLTHCKFCMLGIALYRLIPGFVNKRLDTS